MPLFYKGFQLNCSIFLFLNNLQGFSFRFFNLVNMDTFDIVIEHRGVTRTFSVSFGKYGYSYRFTIDVNGEKIVFEPDEERNLRAMTTSAGHSDTITRELVELIGIELQKQLSS